MQKRFGLVSKPRGPVVPYASVLVKTDPGAVVATLYSDNGITPLANPITCDEYGQYSYYAADGLYSERVSGPGFETTTEYGILINGGSSGDIIALQAEVDALDARVVVLEVAVTTLVDETVVDLQDSIASVVTDVATVAGDVAALDSRVGAVEADVADVQVSTGIFTPTVVGGTTPGIGTYNTNTGEYWKVGRLVTFSLVIDFAAHTGTGNLNIVGMPFAIYLSAVYNLTLQGFTWSAGSSPVVEHTAGDMALVERNPTLGTTTAIGLPTSSGAGYLIIAGSYVATT